MDFLSTVKHSIISYKNWKEKKNQWYWDVCGKRFAFRRSNIWIFTGKILRTSNLYLSLLMFYQLLSFINLVPLCCRWCCDQHMVLTYFCWEINIDFLWKIRKKTWAHILFSKAIEILRSWGACNIKIRARERERERLG